MKAWSVKSLKNMSVMFLNSETVVAKLLKILIHPKLYKGAIRFAENFTDFPVTLLFQFSKKHYVCKFE